MQLLNFIKDLLTRKTLTILAVVLIPLLVLATVVPDDAEFLGTIDVGNLKFDTNTISSTDTDGDIILNPDGSGGVLLNDLTADTVPYLDSNKELTSSSVTPTELGHVSGVTSALQTQLDAKIDDFSSSTDNILLRTDGTSGDAIQESGVTLDDSDQLSGIARINISSTGEIRFEDTSGGEYMGLKAPGTVTASTTLTLPDGDGSNGQAIITDGAGALSWGEAGGGGGSKNYISGDNSDLEGSIGDWTEFDDSSAYVDGAGSTASNLSTSSFSDTGLEGAKVLTIIKGAADAQYEGISVRADTIDGADFGRPLHGSFEVDATDSDYASDDMEVKAYCTTDATNGADVIPVINGAIENRKYKHQFTVQPSSACSDVRISLMVATTNASGYTVNADDFRLGPDSPIPGFMGEGWKAFTPTSTWSADPDVTETGWRKRVGSDLHVIHKISLSGAPPSSILDVDVPETLDTTLMDSDGDPWGVAVMLESGVTDHDGIIRYLGSTDQLRVKSQRVDTTTSDSSTPVRSNNVSQAVPFTFGASDEVHIRYTVPISGWKASASLSSTEVLFQTASANMSLSATQNITTTDETTIELDVSNIDKFNGVDTGNNKYVIPKDGDYLLVAQALFNSVVSSDNVRLHIKKNGSTYLARGDEEQPDAGSQSVSAFAFKTLAKGDEITITAKSSTDTDYNVLSDALSNGEVTGLTVLRWPDFHTFSQFMVNDLVEASAGLAIYSITEDQWGDLDSIDLTPGEWDLSISATYFANGSVTTDDVFIGYGTTSGNNAPDTNQLSLDVNATAMDQTSGNYADLQLEHRGITVTDTTTYYLKAQAETNTTNLEVAYKIQARKIK